MNRDSNSERQTVDDLVATKLEMPQLALRVVKRSRLTDKLKSGLDSKLSLAVAPAGYGKTTLLGEWILKGFPPSWSIAWVSLDSYDNKITRFWSYIAGAIQKVYPKLKNNFQQMVQSGSDLSDFSFLNPLINEIASCPQPICLVLDDYHLITNEQVHQSLSYFIDHQPKNFHLSIASRTTPPIPLSRLKAQGQLLEVLAGDLSFTPQEVDVFFSRVMDLALGPEQVAVLADATEGWIAGLKLAALSIRSKKDLHSMHTDLSGVNRPIFDFLLEEVLNQQDGEIKEFLLKTSVLSEFSPSLCDAILGRSNSRQILNRIIRNHLFVISLDNKQNWYRYHQLFSETLRILLRETYPESFKTLQQKACKWMQENGYPDKAVSYALDAGDLECAAKIIDTCALDAVTHFNVSRLIQWINRLSPDLLEERPQLEIYVVLAYFLMGKMDEVKPRLTRVEQALAHKLTADQMDREYQYIHWQIQALKAVLKCFNEDIDEGIAEIIRVRKYPPEEDNYFVGSMTHILAESYAITGRPNQALQEYQRGMDFALEHNLFFEYAYSLTGHAHVLKTLGRLSALAEDYRRLLDYIAQYDLSEIFKSYALTGLVEIAIDKNDLAQADSMIAEVEAELDLIERAPPTWIRLEFIYTRLAKYYYAYRNYAKANDYLNRALENFQVNPNAIPFLTSDLIDIQVRIWQKLEGNEQHSTDIIARVAQLNPYHRSNIAEQTALARIYISQNMISDAVALLEEIYPFISETGLRERELEILLLLTRCSLAENDRPAAFNHLYHALQIAEPEGYVHPFLEEDQPLRPLLEEMLAQPQPGAKDAGKKLIDFIQDLLENFRSNEKLLLPSLTDQPPQTVFLSQLNEPLSSREEEVLRLLAAGKTTKEIAAALMISINTTKTHLRSIYKKLGVHSKEDALRAAADFSQGS